jgi:quinol-cytochrome oxidoreductase complex cytochrome b subunit
MAHESSYVPGNVVEKWLDDRLPIIRFSKEHLMDYPTPKNLNYWWTFGGILAFMLVVQIVTGIIMAMHYTPHVDLAFNSVEHIRRDVNGGRILQAVHAVGASMFFFAVYIHMFRNLYYGSYKKPREIIWILGVLLFVLMVTTAFMGYVLPWGQMSFWAATVITNIVAADPAAAARWLCRRERDAEPFLLAALPAAIHHRSGGWSAHLGAARSGQQQPDRR